MTVQTVCQYIEEFAPPALQEEYDNSGLLVGYPQMIVAGALICVDVTEDVIQEAVDNGLNLIISHHPLIFGGLKRITGSNEVQRCVIKAIKNDIAIYAAHTNVDSVINGVSGRMAEKLGLKNIRILQPKEKSLLKLAVFVPPAHADAVRKAIFEAGAGHIGNYDSCSYNLEGYGTFRAGDGANPFVGEIGEVHAENEIRIEAIFPFYAKEKVIKALIAAHPYEEPAYDIYQLENNWNNVGFGVIGELEQEEDEKLFLQRAKQTFEVGCIRHTSFLNKKVKRVALCGGAGSFLLSTAIRSKADVFITGDFKYHDFFGAEGKIIIADIGHFESEQFTKEIFYEIIRKKIPTFAVRISVSKTNPINYL